MNRIIKTINKRLHIFYPLVIIALIVCYVINKSESASEWLKVAVGAIVAIVLMLALVANPSIKKED